MNQGERVRIRCKGHKANGAPCGNILGEETNGLFVITHRRRGVVAEKVVAIICEDCQSVWSPDPDADGSEPARALRLIR